MVARAVLRLSINFLLTLQMDERVRNESFPVLASLYHKCARRKRIYKHPIPSPTTFLSLRKLTIIYQKRIRGYAMIRALLLLSSKSW